MKTPSNDHNRNREINTPGEMLARTTYVMMVTAFISAIVLGVTGVISGQWQIVLGAAGAAVISVLSRRWLLRSGKLAAAGAAFDAMMNPSQSEDRRRLAELAVLLEQLEAHEQKRGSAGFDPWALQVVRNEIRVLVQDDPDLEQLFLDYRQRRAA